MNNKQKAVDVAEVVDRSALKLEALRKCFKERKNYFSYSFKEKEKLMDDVRITTPSALVIRENNLPISIFDFNNDQLMKFNYELISKSMDIDREIFVISNFMSLKK